MTSGAALAIVEGRYRVVLRERHPDANFAVGHELGHWALRELARYDGPNEENMANYLGAAILAPPPLLLKAYESFGEHFASIARALRLSQTATVLRLAEVRGDERAIVTCNNRHVIVRSRGGYAWDSERAKTAFDGPIPGLVRARLIGGIDTGRLALRAI